jgi:hypothetical protein
MLKKLILAILVLSVAGLSYSYENSLPNLSLPSNLGNEQMELNFLHRFFDPLNAINPNGLFTCGANSSDGARFMIWGGIEALAFYNFNQTEVKAGVSYTLIFKEAFFRAKIEADYYNYRGFLPASDRINNFVPHLSISSEPLLGFLVLGANVGYDVTNTALGGGVGVDFIFATINHVMLECIFPIVHQDTTVTGSAVFLALAYKIEYGGHHFIFTFANSSDIDMRRLMLGAQSYTNWYFGFTVQRLLDFS